MLHWAPTILWREIVCFCILCVPWGEKEREGPFFFVVFYFLCFIVGAVGVGWCYILFNCLCLNLQVSHFTLLILPYIPRSEGVIKQLCVVLLSAGVKPQNHPRALLLTGALLSPQPRSATAECNSPSNVNHYRGSTGTSSRSCFPTQLQQQMCLGWSHTYQHIFCAQAPGLLRFLLTPR